MDDFSTHEVVGIAAGLDAMLEIDSVFEMLITIAPENGGSRLLKS